MPHEQQALRILFRGKAIGSAHGYAIPDHIITSDGARWTFHHCLAGAIDGIDPARSVVVYPDLLFVRDDAPDAS